MSEHAEIVAELTARQPEHQVAPSLARIAALMDLLGSPQRNAPVIQITGTNGKGSTAIMIDALLRAQGLRTGRLTSPHLADPAERISVDGRAISAETFDQTWDQIRPFVEMVDQMRLDDTAMTFFEVMTGLAFAVFADAPVDVMVLEVGMGGSWDATNVADAEVAVVTPIALDHTDYLGETVAEIALEKSGIIKQGAVAVVAGQQPEVAKVLIARCAEVGARMLVEGIDFSVASRAPAVGGQLLRLQGASGIVDDVELPLYGAHQAANAALALAAVEAFGGGRALSEEVIRAGFGDVVAPGRTERVRTSPAVVIDTAHNPAAVAATMATMAEAFAFAPLIAVVAMMADKDQLAVLQVLAEDVDRVVVTQAQSARAMPAAELAELAVSVFGEDKVTVAPLLPDAIEQAVEFADEAGPAAGVLVIGSVVLAGQVRSLLVAEEFEPELPAVVAESEVDPDDFDFDVDRFAAREWGDQ